MKTRRQLVSVACFASLIVVPSATLVVSRSMAQDLDSPAVACTASIREVSPNDPFGNGVFENDPDHNGHYQFTIDWEILFDCSPGFTKRTLCSLCIGGVKSIGGTQNGPWTYDGDVGPLQTDILDCGSGKIASLTTSFDNLTVPKWYRLDLYACPWDPTISNDCDRDLQPLQLVGTAVVQAQQP